MPHPDRSTRGVAPHPIHALFGAFPIAGFTGALVADLAYAGTADPQWATFSVWLITAGLVMGALAILAGIVAFWRDRAARRGGGGGTHALGSLVAMLLALWNVFVHSRDGWTSVVPTGLVLSALTVAVMAVTGLVGERLARRERAGAAL